MKLKKILKKITIEKENLPLNFQYIEILTSNDVTEKRQGVINSDFYHTNAMLITSFYLPLNIYLPKELTTE